MKPSGLEVWHKQFLKKKNENTGSNVLKRFLHFEIFKNVSFWFSNPTSSRHNGLHSAINAPL
jgi:hypothetical protein